MNNFLIYEKASGQIVNVGFRPGVDDAEALLPAEQGIMIFDPPVPTSVFAWAYVDDSAGMPALLERPGMAPTVDKPSVAAGGVETVTISGLPAGCRVAVTHTTGERDAEGGLPMYSLPLPVDDGIVELSFDQPGTYVVLALLWPYMNWEATIHAL